MELLVSPSNLVKEAWQQKVDRLNLFIERFEEAKQALDDFEANSKQTEAILVDKIQERESTELSLTLIDKIDEEIGKLPDYDLTDCIGLDDKRALSVLCDDLAEGYRFLIDRWVLPEGESNTSGHPAGSAEDDAAHIAKSHLLLQCELQIILYQHVVLIDKPLDVELDEGQRIALEARLSAMHDAVNSLQQGFKHLSGDKSSTWWFAPEKWKTDQAQLSAVAAMVRGYQAMSTRPKTHEERFTDGQNIWRSFVREVTAACLKRFGFCSKDVVDRLLEMKTGVPLQEWIQNRKSNEPSHSHRVNDLMKPVMDAWFKSDDAGMWPARRLERGGKVWRDATTAAFKHSVAERTNTDRPKGVDIDVALRHWLS